MTRWKTYLADLHIAQHIHIAFSIKLSQENCKSSLQMADRETIIFTFAKLAECFFLLHGTRLIIVTRGRIVNVYSSNKSQAVIIRGEDKHRDRFKIA